MAVWLLWREGCLGPVRNMTVHVGSMPHASQLCWAVDDFVQHVRLLGVSRRSLCYVPPNNDLPPYSLRTHPSRLGRQAMVSPSPVVP